MIMLTMCVCVCVCVCFGVCVCVCVCFGVCVCVCLYGCTCAYAPVHVSVPAPVTLCEYEFFLHACVYIVTVYAYLFIWDFWGIQLSTTFLCIWRNEHALYGFFNAPGF